MRVDLSAVLRVVKWDVMSVVVKADCLAGRLVYRSFLQTLQIFP
jgi:hypothetical protein